MGRNRAVRATLASLLLVTSCLEGCAQQPPLQPRAQGSRAAQGPTGKPPFCARHVFGEVKNGEVAKSRAATSVEPTATPPEGKVRDAGKILVQSQPLDALPLEIEQIQRGAVKRFVGKFIKDGEMSWSGVDLDRMTAITVERRVFDPHAHQPRPVPDPRLAQAGDSTFARKWSDAERTEVEVISSFPIDLLEAQNFVCAANSEWADKNPLPDDEDSDQMAQGATDYFLLDQRLEQGLPYRYAKSVPLGPLFGVVLGQIWLRAPGPPVW